MKILHICLAAFYIDGYGYQENIFPKIHKQLGHEVKIIASTETYLASKKLGYIEPSTYQNENGIEVTRLPYVSWLPNKLRQKLRLYKGLTNEIKSFKPDVIYLHDLQFFSIREVVSYVKKNNCRLYVDSHTDGINSARSWVSRKILHEILYKKCATWVKPYVDKFYGTIPLRNEFLNEVYNIPLEKIELLEFGFDDSEIPLSEFNQIRSATRKKLGLKSEDVMLLAGGKIDGRKNTFKLIKAFKSSNIPKEYKLILFGEATQELKNDYAALIDDDRIMDMGWLGTKEINNLIIAADLALFPGTHSVIWEQVVGAGIPAIFKRWHGIEHIDLGGNCLFVETGSEKELKEKFEGICNSEDLLAKMSLAARTKRNGRFLYTEIAKRAVGL